jgi:hypothetical protein
MLRPHWTVAVLALAACQCESSSPRTAPKHHSFAMPAPTQAKTPKARLQAHMAEHLQTARDMQRAIAQGRLPKARELAGWFAQHPLDEKPPWQKYAFAMRGSALRIQAARDLATAGGELGTFGNACASCHVAAGVTPTFTYGPPPREDEHSLEAQMERHQWAATRLWEGVIGPSDREWQEGATVLAVDKLDVSSMQHEKPNGYVVDLAEQLQQQARDAQTMHGTSDRAAFYGRMMTTCAACHQITRPYPVTAGRDD